MARTDTFHVSVVTPEQAVLEAEATSVVFPAHDGEVGILPHRAPLLFKLGAGLLRVETPAGRHAFFVDGGFAQMVNNKLTILTEQARRPEDITRVGAERDLAAARELPMKTDVQLAARQRAVDRARAELRLVN
jgi:F-type H+-transporting ATPase subunit epsilon